MNPKRQTALKILKEKELYGPEEFINQVYAVSGDPRLVSRAVPLGERYMTAFRLLIQMLGSSRPGTSILKDKQEKKEIVQEPKDAEVEGPPKKKPSPSEEEAVPDFYGTLGVKEAASEEEIKVAHRALIKKYHPDVYSGQELSQKELAEIKNYAQEVNLAYDILSKEGNRADYDKARINFPVSPPATPPSTPLTDITKRAGVEITKKAAAKTVGKPAKKGLKKLAGKTAAGKVAGKAVGQVVDKAAMAVGTAIGGPVGAAIAKAISWIGRNTLGLVKKAFGKIAEVLTGEKDTRKQIAYLAAAGTVVFVGLGMVVPAAAAGLVAVGAGAASLGAARIGSGISGIGQSFVYGITAVAAPAIGIPILVALFIIPLVITLIIFIINSGAYVVPYAPALQITAFDNPYVKVEKTADPTEVSNPPPNRTISYTITVTAIQGSLTNISFSNSCEVFGESSGVSCPSVTLPSPPAIISPIGPFTFSYEISIGSSITDSIVSDTFTVTADAPEAPGQSNSSSASVVVGEPPIDCLIPSDNALSWPSSYKNNLFSAILRLTSQHAPYVAKVCAGPQVNLCYDPPAVSLWGYHVHRSDCDILFDSGGLGSVNNATFILAHEISHHLDWINGFWRQAYLDSGAPSELPLCSYGATSSVSEGFAEGNALYVQLPSYWSSRCSGSFQSLYPRHYNFARDVIF